MFFNTFDTNRHSGATSINRSPKHCCPHHHPTRTDLVTSSQPTWSRNFIEAPTGEIANEGIDLRKRYSEHFTRSVSGTTIWLPNQIVTSRIEDFGIELGQCPDSRCQLEIRWVFKYEIILATKWVNCNFGQIVERSNFDFTFNSSYIQELSDHIGAADRRGILSIQSQNDSGFLVAIYSSVLSSYLLHD